MNNTVKYFWPSDCGMALRLQHFYKLFTDANFGMVVFIMPHVKALVEVKLSSN